MTDAEFLWLQVKYLMTARPPHVLPNDAQWQSVWWMFDATRHIEPTEEEKSVHRAISVGNGDAKRFGHGQFIGDDE